MTLGTTSGLRYNGVRDLQKVLQKIVAQNHPTVKQRLFQIFHQIILPLHWLDGYTEIDDLQLEITLSYLEKDIELVWNVLDNLLDNLPCFLGGQKLFLTKQQLFLTELTKISPLVDYKMLRPQMKKFFSTVPSFDQLYSQ